MGMESNLILEFVNKTGADSTTAHSYLKTKGWDLKAAIDGYLCESRSSADHWEENGNLRPSLHKSNAIDLADLKKLTRGISRATDNVKLVSRARSDIALDFGENAVCNVNQYFIETPVFTFTLPDLTVYPDDFREFLEKDLIETSSLSSLETAGRLNWWVELGVCQRLWPLATSGDGNCLLHAASLGMWGFHDRLLTLRRALHGFLATAECREALWRRWRWQQTRLNAEAGLVYSEEEWNREWEGVVNMASTQPRKLQGGGWRRNSLMLDRNGDDIPENATYESLEEIHVLALAHVLRRPIIVIADVMLKDINGDDLAPIGFGGIYLPLECSPADCHRSPLVLTYDAAHFSALVVMEREAPIDTSSPYPPAAIPLTSADRQLLPIQFSVDPGEQFIWGRDELIPHITQKLSLAPRDQLGLLSEYLDVMKITPPNCSQSEQEQDVEINDVGITDEDEIDKRFCEVIPTDAENEGEGIIFGGKAARQLQSVAKQFGSIGKSMGRKLRKNLGSITKMSRSNSQKKPSSRLNNHAVQDHIVCALLNTEQRHEYQAEMVRNYLQCARTRFELRENGIDTGARYGAGRSRFYTGSDARTLPPSMAPRLEPDRTLYLARSTFYDDVHGTSPHDKIRSYNMSSHSRTWGEHGEWSGIESGRGSGDSSRHSVVTTLTPPQASFPDLPYVEHVAQPCRNNACHFYGSPDRDHYCSRCYREQSNTSVGGIRCLQVQEINR